jgi:hypothetical protein
VDQRLVVGMKPQRVPVTADRLRAFVPHPDELVQRVRIVRGRVQAGKLRIE